MVIGVAAYLTISPQPTATSPVEPTLALTGGEPSSYRITYRVRAGDEVTTEVLSVRRPFDSRLVVRSGRPPGEAVRSVRTGRFGTIEADSATSEPLRLTVPPSLAPSDLRLRPTLEAAAAAGIVRATGRRTVAGRPCELFVTGGPVSAGTLVPLADAESESAEICVDARGLLLEERWLKSRTVLRHRRAVAVSALSEMPRFGITGAKAPASGQDGSITRVTDESRLPLGSFELSGPPLPGFERLGRWASISPRLGELSGQLEPDAGRRAALHEIWTRGVDVFTVEQGSLLGVGGPLEDHPHGISTDLGSLGTGQSIHDLRLNEVRANVPGFGYVRVTGTVPLADVISVARRLTREPGGSLVPMQPTTQKEEP